MNAVAEPKIIVALLPEPETVMPCLDCALAAADGGGDVGARAVRELQLIRAVRLPEKHRDQGPKSAEVLLHLRCEVLARSAGDADDGPVLRSGEER